MSEILKFETAAGPGLLVEVSDDSPGLERVARRGSSVIETGRRLDDELEAMRPSFESILKSLSKMAPQQYSIEFGIKLNVEAGVVVAKSALEGHFTVRMSWGQEESS